VSHTPNLVTFLVATFKFISMAFFYLAISGVGRPLQRHVRLFEAFHHKRDRFYPMMGPFSPIPTPDGGSGVVCAGSSDGVTSN